MSNNNNAGSCTWESFVTRADRFLHKTQEHALQGVNPGGVYQAIWCRDASYILKDWFLCGNADGALQQIYQIWSHQISINQEKLVYGRGSPEMKFLSEVASVKKQKEFEGALPTTIYQAGFSEIYGQNPDIDSTALMISTSSWILARSLLREEEEQQHNEEKRQSSENTSSGLPPPTIASEHSSDYVSALLSKIGITNPSEVIKLVVPSMLRAIEYLNSRDIDNDGLLEQNHNEDWMDTILRAGKIVYDQACWILALNNLSALLSKLGRDREADRLMQLADKTINAVDQRLWSEEDGCYLDIQESYHIGGPYRTLTQDTSFYLVAITENTVNDNFRIHDQKKKKQQQEPKKTIYQNLQSRAISSLDAIRSRVWKDKWPLVTEAELKSTGPWLLKPYQYHNHTFWPWTTGIEMLARSRFNRIGECDILLSKLASEEHPHIHTFYEWINPITDQGNGAYPFRTGISTVRIAIADILKNIKRQESSHSQTTTEA